MMVLHSINLDPSDLFGDTGTAPLAPEGAESRVKTAKGTELQPRNRGRDASSAWVRKTAQDLDPNLLGKSPRADSGAPIVGPDSKRP